MDNVTIINELGFAKNFIVISTFFSAFPPVLLGIFIYKYLQGKYKILFWFMCLALATQIFSFFNTSDVSNTVYLLHFYVPVEFIVFSILYINLLKGYVDKRIIIAIAVLLVSFSVINSFFIQPIRAYNNIVRCLCSFFLAVYSIAYFMKILNEIKIKKLSDEPSIWINAAVLIYFTGNLLTFAFGKVLFSNRLYWILSAVLVDAFYGLIFIGFWKIYRKNVRNRQKLNIKPILKHTKIL